MPRAQGRASDRTYLSIREVLDLLLEEFPDVTISKIRFLESRGLIHPERTPSGYRKFYESDVERLRWILRQQREHFLPLKVIKGRLEQNGTSLAAHESPSLFDTEFDDGEHDDDDEGHSEPEPTRDLTRPRGRLGHPSAAPALESVVAQAPPTSPTPAASPAPAKSPTNGSRRTPARRTHHGEERTYTRGEIGSLIGASESLLVELEEFGLVRPLMLAGAECFDESARRVVEIALRFAAFGIEPRHLKSLKHATEREAALYSQVVAPLVLQRNPDARERAESSLNELGELGASWRDVFLAEELRGPQRG